MSMLHIHAYVHVHVELPECWTVRHLVSSVSGLKKTNDAGTVRYRTKLNQSGIFLVRYRTKIRDARMPMPALVYSMTMPSYGGRQVIFKKVKVLSSFTSIS